MAEIKFYGNFLTASNDNLIRHDLGSGIGFYGLDFGVSVPVGSQQSTTWITNADGTNQGARLHNTAKVASGIPGVEKGTVSVDGASPAIDLDKLSNYLCPLNIRFTHSTPVKVQNGKLRIFARDHGIDKPASGVTTWVYEARKPVSSPSISSLNLRGVSDFVWKEFDPTLAQTELALTPSPGMSGLNTSTTDTTSALGYTSQGGSSHQSSQHDWYIALSSEPEGIGSKTNYGLYYTVEYL